MKSTVIMPCAGKSTRFNGTRIKWMLTHPNGNLMLIEAIRGLDLENVSNIIITVVKEHIDDSKIDLNKVTDKIFELTNIKPEFCILNTFTSSQSDTVYQTILSKDVVGPIFIKDCDNYFEVKVDAKNSVCISQLKDGINAINKSYVSLNKFGYLSGMAEKQIISDKFCVGGYSFADAKDFIREFDSLKEIKSIDVKELYISHIIQSMIISNHIFDVQQVEGYLDWGTLEDWSKYTKQFNTIFLDLDGVLVENSSEFFSPKWGDSRGLTENINTINKLYHSGKSVIIITTSRLEDYEIETYNQLNRLGIKYHRVIFGLPHAKRILINDFSGTNPYPSAVAICLKRNEDNLKDLI